MQKRHLKKVFSLVVLCVCLIFISPADSFAVSFKTTVAIVMDPAYTIQILVPGSYFHGIHGLTSDSQDNLYAGSVVGEAIYHVDTNTGEVEEFIGPPNGMADDLVFGPDGRIYYTSFLQGKLQSKGADGKITLLADNLMGINSLAFNKEGRLFATQVFLGDALLSKVIIAACPAGLGNQDLYPLKNPFATRLARRLKNLRWKEFRNPSVKFHALRKIMDRKKQDFLILTEGLVDNDMKAI